MEEVEPLVEPSEPLVEPSESVVIKRRGRPKGSLNKKNIEKMKADALIEDGPEEVELPPALPSMTLDVDFNSDEILGEKPQAVPRNATKQRRPKAPKARPPPSESESLAESPPQPPKLKRERTLRSRGSAPTTKHVQPEPQPLNPPTYLEVLTRDLKEARANQYADKVAQYDNLFQW